MVVAKYPRSIRFDPRLDDAIANAASEYNVTFSDIVVRACYVYLTENLEVDVEMGDTKLP